MRAAPALLLVLAWALGPRPARAQEALRLMRRYGCSRCHEIEGVRTSRRESCVGCHRRVVERQRGRAQAPSVRHYVHAPDLDTAGRRLREGYLVAFLQDPHDVRPRLEETMPRLPVTAEDARTIARFLRRGAPDVPRGPAPRRENVAAGRAVFDRAGCATCHELGNLDLGRHLPPEALAGLGQAAFEAPNLRFVRDRLDPDVALAWIHDPRSVAPDAQMPATELSLEDAVRVRDFLWFASPGAPSPPAAPDLDLRPLARRVHFPEVRRVFDSSCIHCHAHADGRTAGALGFEPSSLDLSSLEGVREGVVRPDGSRRSILEPDESGLPPLLRRLVQRHAEARRDIVPSLRDPLDPVSRERPTGVVGMPLGLPPLDPSRIRMIATWIAQGAPP